MKKTLLAVAVLGAFATPALADVTIIGGIAVGINRGSSSSVAGGAGNTVTGAIAPLGSVSNWSTSNNYSNVNLESVDDIGNGNKVVYHLQLQHNVTATGDVVGKRDSFIGLQGSWGAFRIGTNENIYEQYMYESDPLDGAVGAGGNLNLLGSPGYGTVFDVGNGGGAGFYRRTDHTVWYTSPDMNGFTFAVNYTLNAFKGRGGGLDPTILSMGAQFKQANWFANVGYEQHDDLNGLGTIAGTVATGSDDTGLQFGGGLTLGNINLYARWENLEYNSTAAAGVNGYERDAVWVAIKVNNVGSGYFGAELGRASDADCSVVGGGDCDASKSGATLLGVGYFHNLSQRSQLQFIVSRTANDDNASYFGIGAPGNGRGNFGSDHTAFTFNIKHVF